MPDLDAILLNAAKAGNAQVIQGALAAGANPNASRGSSSALALALQSLHSPVESARALLEAGASASLPNHRGRTPLQCALAAPAHRLRLAELLLSAGADPNALGQNGALYLREILAGDPRDALGLARLALERGADPDVLDSAQTTVLDWAIDHSEAPEALIALLLEFKANPQRAHKTGALPLERAFQSKRPLPAILALLAGGADPNQRSQKNLWGQSWSSPLITALKCREFEFKLAVVNALLAAKADPNLRDDNGVAPSRRLWRPRTVLSGSLFARR